MLRAKKSLGQHFLHDPAVLDKIIAAFNPQPDDYIVEIGPGEGALTQRLASQPGNLTCVEIDRRAIGILQSRLPPSVEIVLSNILDFDLDVFADQHKRTIRVIGNTPYYLSTEILFWLFSHHTAVSDAVLMMQREVGERLTAVPGTKEYGILTVMTNFYASVQKLFHVSRRAFVPPPRVDSIVVRLIFKNDIAYEDPALLSAIVRTTFGKRRKILRNTLRSAGVTDDGIARLPIDCSRRPETLTVEEFICLARALEPVKRHLKMQF
jgi:16S rRNA (adenine1518-N6/adenine1519-N6)-dimethyltransferase